ncbi:acid-sensing ion channel 5 [Plakobranchus ocellatus]|uniref:Acid-sensing ion channel 5 n=1 Tax=Plakobranchus ocellatus TaxID=259542 RepID=A0AAV3Z3V5_9GAST|nr:acid-sensing ion channel 5 [Plakobranchus ocellatus]
MASLKELLEYFAGCDLKNYNTPGHDNLQQTCRTVINGRNDKHNKNINTVRKKIGIISAISSRRKNRKHTSIKTKENLSFDHNIRWSFMTDLYGNYPAPTAAGASDVESNCTASKTPKATTTTKRKHRTAKNFIHEFTQSTSMHGVQHIMRHRSVWRRMVWSVLVIGFVAWAAHNVYQIISDYKSNPVQTSVSSEYQSKLNFPAVTVCNLNRIKLSKAPQSLVQILPHYTMVGCDLKNYNTPGHDNLQQTYKTVNNGRNDKHNKNINTVRKKIGIISAISSRRKKRKHIGIKTKENLSFDHSTRCSFITDLYGNYPAPTAAGASDVESNCTTTKTTKATTTTKRKHTTAKNFIHEFTQSTSMHGAQHIMRHRSVWRRMVWSVLVIGFVAWAVHNVYQIVCDYKGNPVQTSVSSEYQSKINFPAVTVCNLNRIKLSKAPQSLVRNLPYYIMVGKVDFGHWLVF